MKKFMPFIIFSAVVILAILIIATAVFFDLRTDSFFTGTPLQLPESKEVYSVTVIKGKTSAILETQTEIDALWDIFSPDRESSSGSHNDGPIDGDDGTMIIMEIKHTPEEQYGWFIFAYESKGKYFLEKPYNGIYELTQEEYRQIEHFLK